MAPGRPGQGVLLSRGATDSSRLKRAALLTIACMQAGIKVDRCTLGGTAIAVDGRRFFLADGFLAEEAEETDE